MANNQNPLNKIYQRDRVIVIPGVKGGLARDLYEDLTIQTYQAATDVDVYSNRNSIRPVFPALQDMALPSQDAGATAVKVFNTYLSSNGKYYLHGEETISAVVNNALWETSALAASPTYSRDFNNAGLSGNYPLEEYKDGLFFSDRHLFKRWGNLSGSPSATTIGTLGTTTERYGHFLNHKGLAKIFFTHGDGGVYTKIGWYDNSTFTEGVLSFGAGFNIVSVQEAGQFVLIGIKATNDGQRSRYLLWDGAAVTVEDSQDLGDVGLNGIRMVNGVANIVTLNIGQTSAETVMRISTAIPGYTPQLQFQQRLAATAGVLDRTFEVYGNIMYFGLDNIGLYTYGTRILNVPKYTSNLRLMNGAPTSWTYLSVRVFGSVMIICWIDTSSGNVYKMSTTGISSSQSAPSTGIYTSDLIPIDDNLEFKGSIKKIKIYHKTLPANCGYTVWVKQYGRYIPGTTVPSADTFTKVGTITAANSEYAVIEDDGVNFDLCDSFQLQIKLDTVSGANYPEVLFPIIIRAGISGTK